MDKLKAKIFIRHKNGDTLDNRATNLKAVTIQDAFKHVNDWKVDWVCFVTNEERSFLVDMLAPTPEVYFYFKWRAFAHPEETNAEDESTPSMWKNLVNRSGPRTDIAGVRFDETGQVVQDVQHPEYMVEFRARQWQDEVFGE